MTCEECGCRITAEVHKKPSGRQFIYYRCANGKKQHDKLVRLTQPAVVEQLESAVDAIHITEDFATQLPSSASCCAANASAASRLIRRRSRAGRSTPTTVAAMVAPSTRSTFMFERKTYSRS